MDKRNYLTKSNINEENGGERGGGEYLIIKIIPIIQTITEEGLVGCPDGLKGKGKKWDGF